MKIIFPFHTDGFDSLKENEKKEADMPGKETLCAILYIENLDKSMFADLKKRVENDYVLNKAEYPSNVNTVQGLLLNYQPKYNCNKTYQSNRVSNQLIFEQHR